MTEPEGPTRGVILQPVDEPGRFTDMVDEIESLGFANLWCTDSSLHARNAYAYLTMAALSTTRLRIGTAVTNPLSRHPAVTAVAAATVDEISGGRFILGIGAGDRPLLALGLAPSRLGDLGAAVEDIRRLWRGETVDADGPGFAFRNAHLRIPARPDLPVYLSASGPKTLALAGGMADGVLILTGLFGAAAEWAVSCVRRGADDAGRIGADRPHIAVCAYGAIDDERPADALAAAGTIATWFPQTAPVVCELAGLDPTVVQRVRSAYQAGEFQEAAAVARLLPHQFVEQVALAGGRASAARQIRTVLDAGADSVELFPLGRRRMETVRAFVDAWDLALGAPDDSRRSGARS